MLKAAVIAGVLAFAGASHASPVFFDDFEGYALGTPSALSPTWKLATGSVDVIGQGNGFGWYGPGQYIDMNGTSWPDSAAQITTTVTLKPGSYVLSFDYGYNQNSGPNETLFYSLGNGSEGVSGNLGPADFAVVTGATMATRSVRVRVTQAASFDLSFWDGQRFQPDLDNDWGGAIIDNVSVAPVPVPAAGILLAGALGGLAAIRRRRRA